MVQVKVTYEKQPDGIFFYLNDNFNIAKRLNARFDESTADNIICNYDNTEKRVFGASEVSYEISKCLNGEPFNGFSGKAYLQIGFESVNAEARLKVYSINKQALWKFTKDTVAPQIITTTAIGQVAQGTIVRITPAIYMDVLDPNITSQFSVTDNNGDYVRALDGTLLKEGECDPTKTYQIKADVYGDYSIVYTCRDTKASRAGSVLMSFSVADLVAPEVSIVGALQSAKVGDAVRVASLSVNDNYSQNCTIYYAYSDPNGRVHALGIAKDGLPSFTAKEKGTYIVHCYVFDEANNSTFISYEVIIG